jgi:hypothetical protein
MKKHNFISLVLIILFLLNWTIYHVANTHDHPLIYTQQMNSFEDNSGTITLDKLDKKLPFILDPILKYDEILIVLLLLLVHFSALILHLRRHLILGPVFYQSNNVIHSI